jgi:hypothetical protein
VEAERVGVLDLSEPPAHAGANAASTTHQATRRTAKVGPVSNAPGSRLRRQLKRRPARRDLYSAKRSAVDAGTLSRDGPVHDAGPMRGYWASQRQDMASDLRGPAGSRGPGTAGTKIVLSRDCPAIQDCNSWCRSR